MRAPKRGDRLDGEIASELGGTFSAWIQADRSVDLYGKLIRAGDMKIEP